MKKTTLIFTILSCIAFQGFSQKNNTPFSVVFYNVENLFDTINSVGINDTEFTPNGEKQWNSGRYNGKLDKLSEVISSVYADRLPDIIGLCEIENKQVIIDLINTENLKKNKFEIVHEDSPDARGIDNALVYNKSTFKYLCHETLAVDIGSSFTRDILYVTGVVGKKDTLHVLVNHWPSRGGGEEKSRPKRAAAAKVLRSKIDEITRVNPNAKIIVMGDFNDHPNDESVLKVLNANGDLQTENNTSLFNLMYRIHVDEGRGSYNYRGEWGALDQIIVSRNLVNSSSGLSINPLDADVFDADFIMYVNKQGEKSPSRTYGGNNYYGGFSDHLPVFATFFFK